MKKFLSIAIAVCMIMSMGAIAYATDVSDASSAQAALHAAGPDLVLNLTGDVTDPLIVDWRTTDEGYDQATQPSGVGYLVYPMVRNMGDLTVQGNGTTEFAGFTFNSNLTKFDGSDGAGGHHVTSDACFVIDTLKFKDVKITEMINLYHGGAGRATIDSVVFENVTFDVSSDICAYIGTGTVNNSVTFSNCHFNGVSKAAIEISGPASGIDVTIDDCTFDGPTRAALLSSDSYSGDITLTNNEIATSGDRAFRITNLESTATVTVENNTAYNNGTMVDGDDEVMKITSIADGATVTATDLPENAVVKIDTNSISITGDFSDMTMESGKIKTGTFETKPDENFLADGNTVIEGNPTGGNGGEGGEGGAEREDREPSEPTPAEIERDRVVAAIKAAEDGETVVLDVKDTSVVSRFIADAMSGKNVNLEYALGEETVTVNGKSVPKTPAYRVWYSLELFKQFA